MTRTQYFVAASADGFIADSEERLDWLTSFDGAEGIAAHYESFLAGVGALAMGAATYEWLVAHAPGGAWPYAGRPTWVFTHRALPQIAGADVRFTQADVASVHAEMVRAAAGRNVWLVGGGELAAQLAARGLVDEILLTVIPVVLGRGTPLLPVATRLDLELEELTRFGRGAVELRYRVRRAA